MIISSCKGDEKTFYKVSFNTQGGSTIDSIVLDGQKTIAKPTPDPTRDGYTFGGWFSNADATTAFDFSAPIKANITLYAKWLRQFTVTFNLNGGDGIKSANQTVKSGDTVKLPKSPTRIGYEFEGWFVSADATSRYKFSTKVTKDIRLTAKWTQMFTVTFNLNGGDGTKPIN